MTTFARLWASPRGRIGAIMLGVAAAVAVFAPQFATHDPYVSERVGIDDIYAAPNALHVLGTDDRGRDVFSALLYGARVSLLVGFAGAAVALAVGGLVGLVAGYRGGWVGSALMRFTDLLLVVPQLALQIVIVAIVGQSLRNIILVIGLLSWTVTARLVRAQTLAVKERKYVARARAVGASDSYILVRHVFPQVVPLMLANTVLTVSYAILSESTLAFIGLGDPSLISWGQMLNFAFNRGAVSAGAWWALIPPGLAIVWVVLGVTLAGNALEDVVNPRRGRHHLEPEAEPHATAEADSDAALSVADLTVEYVAAGGHRSRAVEAVTLSVRPGEAVGLVGESGSGKTTAMLAALRLLPPEAEILSGGVRVGGVDVLNAPPEALRKMRWSRMAVVFQGAMNALNPVRDVEGQIAEAIRIHDRSVSREAAVRQARRLLDLVGIGADRGREYPHQFSGGMRQRAMIALALACEPEVIVADEPTTALDVMIQAQILELLDRLRREMGMALVLISHDLALVAERCDRVAVMYGGRVVERGPVSEVFTSPRHPYTRLLLEASPDLAHPDRPLASIPGSPPSLDDLPAGCRFAPRCPYAFAACQVAHPRDYVVADGWEAACYLLAEAADVG